MGFEWNRQNIEWFSAASRYTGFHQKVARLLLPFLQREDVFGDFGCGLGLVDLELAPHLSRIIAIDQNERVIEQLRRSVEERGISNLEARVGDCNQLGELCDVGLMSFFGKSGQDMAYYRSLCRRRLIRIVNNRNASSLYPAQYRTTQKDTGEEVGEELRSRGMSFSSQEVTLEFGQPLRSRQDGHAFLRSHAPEAPQQELEAFLAEHAVETDREEYPLYLPNPKEIVLFVID